MGIIDFRNHKIPFTAWICFIFFIINLIIKFYQITSIPPGSPYDENYYAVEAQTIKSFGSDLSGTWHPWDLSPAHGMYSELTGFTLIPGFLVFPHSPILAGKFMPVLLGSVLPICLALIAYYFIRNRLAFVTIAIVATLNPWLFQFSRLGYDSMFSLSLLNIGIVFILYFKNWNRLWALIPLFFAFFQYQGHKLVFAPLVIWTLILVGINSRLLHKVSIKVNISNIISLLIIAVFCIGLTASYAIRLPHLSSSMRMNEFSSNSNQDVTTIVNDNRRLTISNPFVQVFDNKHVTALPLYFKRFLLSFDPITLFVEGNKAVDTFAVNNYGFFHWLDLALFIIGVIVLGKSKKNIIAFVYIAGYIIIGTIPNVLRNGNMWITFRGAFTFAGLIMLAGIGLGGLIQAVKTTKHKMLLVLSYILLTLSFFYIYFFRYPLLQTIHPAFYDRVLTNYIKRQPDKNFIIVSSWTSSVFNYILHYNQMITGDNKQEIKNSAMIPTKTLANVLIVDQCPENMDTMPADTVMFVEWIKVTCPALKDSAFRAIKSPVDSGLKYLVGNDTLCSKYVSSPYIHITKNVFNVEQLADEEFCTAFFAKDN